MRDILFIINGIPSDNGKLGISGGDVRLIEVAKNTKLFNVYFLTTPNGEKILNRFGLKRKRKYIISQTNSSSAVDNIKLTFWSLLFIPRELNNYNGIVYSSCEHLYDVLPALRLKLFNRCRWLAVYHWVEDYPWNEDRGGTPVIRRYLYWANRYISGFIIKYFADKILAVSNKTKTKLVEVKKVNPQKIKEVKCGVNFEKISSIVSEYSEEAGKKYDAVYMKRLDFGKGVFDLIKIWALVCKDKTNAKLVIIGTGSKLVNDGIKELTKKYKIQKNVVLLGPVYDFKKKIRILNSSKLFILPSHEENWAIVIGEALAVRLPVIVYSLKEIKDIWKDKVIWVRKGDIHAFANKIINVLTKETDVSNFLETGQTFMKDFDWNKIAKEEFNYI